jgi:hypothetical protein
MDSALEEQTAYLLDGGLGEVLGLASIAREMSEPKVLMDTDMAIALCLLADEAAKARKNLAA